MPDARPNILYIMTDDHAAHAMSCYGSRINQTPNLDRIAEGGVRFDNCFCTNSICEPSRATILTGTYNHINGVTTIGAHIDNTQENVAKIFQRNGYQTAVIGKWHLGQGPAHWPTGFDHYNILQGQGPYFNPEMVRDGEKVNYEGYTTDVITDLSLEWLEKREQDKPFLLMYQHKAPHRPWNSDEKHAHMYDDVDIPEPETFNDDYATRSEAAHVAKMRVETDMNAIDLKTELVEGFKPYAGLPVPEDLSTYSLTTKEGETVTFSSPEELKSWKYQRYIKEYLRCVASVDDNVGRVLDWLDEQGLAENTIVIYTSDQGFFLGDHGWYDKRFMYEESLRMPYVMRYPKEIAAGTVCTDMALNADFAPTWLDYAGIEIPEYMQGQSFRPNVRGETPGDWRQGMYYRYWMHRSHHNVYAHYGIRTHQYKLIYYYSEACGQPNTIDEPGKREWELFDLQADPCELNNVYHNPAYAEAVAELKDELHRLQAEVKDEPYEEVE
ncbi:MAG: sulfatase [Victivallales bacterium]|jgi:arylsulfatase A-like enzyme|nr:sulfatase [Victivallales bacterium]MBT7302468.1 sulfatase [Victivallales bacterium]